MALKDGEESATMMGQVRRQVPFRAEGRGHISDLGGFSLRRDFPFEWNI